MMQPQHAQRRDRVPDARADRSSSSSRGAPRTSVWHVWLCALASLVWTACAQTETAYCGDDFRCPAGSFCVLEGPMMWTCVADTVCGDGIAVAFAGEQCDDSNTIGGDGCSADCKLEECGNGILDSAVGEVCDDGNIISGDGCNADCSSNETCGNDILDTDAYEVCDDGNAASGDGCSADCASQETCGNGYLDTAVGEVCDDGNIASGDGCRFDCLSDETCGNNIIDAAAGEVCDDGNIVAGDGCSSDCSSDETCGNNIIDLAAGEVCDDGNVVSGDDCSGDCLSTEICGNGYTDAVVGEECDSGGDSAMCDSDCTAPVCGDGYANLIAGEACDDAGESATCDGDCTAVVCGDNNVNSTAGEVCDTGGESAMCDGDCTAPVCGDGHVNPAAGEQCDDPLASYCSGSCQLQLQLATGARHTCVRMPNGEVRCWGQGIFGQLGHGNTDDIGDDEQPATIADVAVGSAAVQIGLGGTHTCALTPSGGVRCWGRGQSGQLGLGDVENIGDDETPDSTSGVIVGGTATQLAVGGDHTCALLDTNAVRCWGRAAGGQLGYGNTDNIGDNELPASVGDVGIGGDVQSLSAGAAHTCALLSLGSVRCWGRGVSGQLGYVSTENIGDDETPSSAGGVDVGGAVTQLATGGSHTCALLSTGAVRCWGRGAEGQLGYGNIDSIGDNETPDSAGDVDVGGQIAQLVAGGSHTCALLNTGAVRCWGRGAQGQLGYGNANNIGDDERPRDAGNVPLGRDAAQLAAGESHTCALLTDGAIRCWGRATEGQLGYGDVEDIGDDETPASAGDVPYR